MPAPVSVDATLARARLGAQLRRVRGEVSQEELAARLGLHVDTLRRIERGHADLPQRLLIECASALGVALVDLWPEDERVKIGLPNDEPIERAFRAGLAELREAQEP